MGPFCPHCGTDLGAATAVDPEDDDDEDDELADDDGPE